MRINLDHMEIKCLELVRDRIRRTYILNLSVNLQPIVIYDHNQIVQLACTGKHGCLPDLSLLDLTISQDRIGAVIRSVQLGGKRHTHCC